MFLKWNAHHNLITFNECYGVSWPCLPHYWLCSLCCRGDWYRDRITPGRKLLPVFSQSKINNCHSDITFPTHFNWQTTMSENEKNGLLPWKSRSNVLFFRGSTTGELVWVCSSPGNCRSAIKYSFLSSACKNPHPSSN